MITMLRVYRIRTLTAVVFQVGPIKGKWKLLDMTFIKDFSAIRRPKISFENVLNKCVCIYSKNQIATPFDSQPKFASLTDTNYC